MAIRLLSSESINGALTIGGALTGTSATFAGNVAIQSTIPKLSFTDLQQDDWDILNDNGEFKFLCSTGSGVALQLNTNNNATFAGTVTGTIARFDTLNNNANSANIIYRSGTDTIVGGGSPPNKIYIQDSGNVGIGATSPSTQIHNLQKTNDRAGGFYTQLNGNNYGLSMFVNSGGYGIIGSNGNFTTDVLTMDLNSGNVGIGTATPQKKVHIEGTGGASEMQILVSSASDTVGHTAGIGLRGEGGEADSDARIKGGIFFERIAGSFGNGKMILAVNSSVSNTSVTVADHALTIDNNKNVGIGTTSPASKFEVYGGNSGVNDVDRYVRFKASNGEKRFDFHIGGTGNASRLDMFQADGTTYGARISSTGDSYFLNNLGIGTTSPSGALHVKSSTATTTGMVRLQNDMDNNYETLRIESLGNYDAHIGFLANGTSDYWWGIGIDYSDSGKFKISGDNILSVNTRLTIDTSGNVGIGTTSPITKLHVSNAALINDAYGLALVENTSTGTGSAANSALNIKSKYGTSQFMQWENQGLRIGSRIIDNSAVGDVYFTAGADSVKMVIKAGGNVGIGTTNPGAELEVSGRAIVEKLEVARYSDVNAPAAVYIGRSGSAMGQGGIFRLGAIESSSTVNKIDEPFVITYSSGHWGSQPTFMAEFTVTYYRSSYVKYWCQHEVSGSRLDFMQGPFGGQIITGGAPVSRTITQLCTNCHGGQPVYKCVWKWSNSGTYIKTSPVVTLLDGPGSGRVYTSGSSTESAVDSLYSGSSGNPGSGYFLMGINNAQASGFTGLQTQN